MNFFLSLAIVSALAFAMPAAGMSEVTAFHSLLCKANCSIEVASYHSKTLNVTFQMVEVVSNGNKTGFLSYGNESIPPLGLSMQTMTNCNRQFLNSQYTRRKAWHKQYNKGYIPLL
jgi:hypothetical protein